MIASAANALAALALVVAVAGCQKPGPAPRPQGEGVAPTAAAAPPSPRAEPAPSAPAAPLSAASAAAGDDRGCVEDLRAHALPIILREHGEAIAASRGRPLTPADKQDIAARTSVGPLPDLDGDGFDDSEVTLGEVWGSYGSLHLIYVSAHGCIRFVDHLVAGELAARAERSAGLRDLEARWSNGCAGNDFVWTRYRYDGSRYAVAEEATCELCSDAERGRPKDPKANQHPVCSRH